jgi:hypothetical protein
MTNRNEITREQAFYAIENGEFGDDVLKHEKVVVIMTQDWCPQWINMNRWIYSLKSDKSIEIFELVYNKTDYYRDFMKFKESTFDNHSVPYLRFYKNGKLVNETNYINMQRFQEILNNL